MSRSGDDALIGINARITPEAYTILCEEKEKCERVRGGHMSQGMFYTEVLYRLRNGHSIDWSAMVPGTGAGLVPAAVYPPSPPRTASNPPPAPVAKPAKRAKRKPGRPRRKVA